MDLEAVAIVRAAVGEASFVGLVVVSAEDRRSFGVRSAPGFVGDRRDGVFEHGSGRRWKQPALTNASVFVAKELDGPGGVLSLRPSLALSFGADPLHGSGESFGVLPGGEFKQFGCMAGPDQTPRVTLRPPTDDGFVALIEVVREGVHDPPRCRSTSPGRTSRRRSVNAMLCNCAGLGERGIPTQWPGAAVASPGAR